MKFREANLPQVVGTCVVSSFTEKSCHPAKKAMVPTILIDDAEFRIVLCDCDKDVLYVGSPNAKILYLYCADQKFSDFRPI